MRPQKRSNRKVRPVAKNCAFCERKLTPNYKEVGVLTKFVSERGKIVGRAKTGLCSKHQRDITMHIKYARHVAFLPFIVRT